MLALTKIGFLLVAYQVAFIQCKCPNVKPTESFCLAKFASGVWYDVAVSRNKYPNGEILSTLRYRNGGGSVFFSPENLSSSNDRSVSFSGKVVSPGQISGSYRFSRYRININITVVALDDDFQARVVCFSRGNSQAIITWVSSRQEDVDERVTAKINKFLGSFKDPTTNQAVSWKTRPSFNYTN